MKLKPIRLLLVEDNPIDVCLLRADFAKFGTGFTFTAATDLPQAIHILQQDPIDVILLDLFLKETSGLETLFRIRETSPDVPVVVLTSLNDEAQALQALKSGAQDYLIKGNVDAAVLFRAIRYAIERKQAEEERGLLEQRLLYGQKLEAVGTLAGGVAHNFNNMLMVILGHSTLLIEKLSGSDRSQVESIKSAAERAVLLTRQLLTFSRKEPTEPARIDLNRLILNMQVLLESTLDTTVGIEMKLTSESTLLKADPGKIREALMNLVMNARNAMTNGGKLTIATENRNGNTLLRITDTGIGMSPETLAHIFEPFFTTKGLPMASGLGLSTVYGIVKQHGGSIEVVSKLGQGSTFSISFPGLDGLQTVSPRSPTILVVADEDSTIEFQLRDVYQTGQYNILIAGNWRDALELADDYKGSIDLLITDAVPPGLTRSRLLRHLAHDHRKMKIIYLVGNVTASMAGRGSLPEGAYLDGSAITPQGLLECVKATMTRVENVEGI